MAKEMLFWDTSGSFRENVKDIICNFAKVDGTEGERLTTVIIYIITSLYPEISNPSISDGIFETNTFVNAGEDYNQPVRGLPRRCLWQLQEMAPLVNLV